MILPGDPRRSNPESKYSGEDSSALGLDWYRRHPEVLTGHNSEITETIRRRLLWLVEDSGLRKHVSDCPCLACEAWREIQPKVGL